MDERLATLPPLAYGAHNSPEQGMCLLEATAHLAGEPFNDHPACVSPILAACGRTLNDRLNDASRQALIAFIPRLLNTAGDPERDQRRAYLAADIAVREIAPTALDRVGLTEQATTLRTLAPIADESTARIAADAARAAARAVGVADAAVGVADAAAYAADAAADAADAAVGVADAAAAHAADAAYAADAARVADAAADAAAYAADAADAAYAADAAASAADAAAARAADAARCVSLFDRLIDCA